MSLIHGFWLFLAVVGVFLLLVISDALDVIRNRGLVRLGRARQIERREKYRLAQVKAAQVARESGKEGGDRDGGSAL